MASNSDASFKELTSPVYNESLQAHNLLSFKLVKTVADFTQQWSIIHERHSEELQMLVETFRKRNADIRKERIPYVSSLFSMWEQLLQQVEVETHSHGEIAKHLTRNLGTGLLEKTFHKKIQSRKAFLHRESMEAILNKAEETLQTLYQEYCAAYKNFLAVGSQTSLSQYYDTHNNYVQQLHATNGMIKLYQVELLPKLLEEIQSSYLETSATLASAVQVSTEFIACKSKEHWTQYQSLSSLCKSVNGKSDLSNFIRGVNQEIKNNPQLTPPNLLPWRMHSFTQPCILDSDNRVVMDMRGVNNPNILQNEVIVSPTSLTLKIDSLRQEIRSLEGKISKLEESIDSLKKLQARSLDSKLFNKSNEIQEDLSIKKFEYQVGSLHLAAVKSQLELYLMKERDLHGDNGLAGANGANGMPGSSSGQGDSSSRKSSSSSTSAATSIKNRWIKAFKTLKTAAMSPSPPSFASPVDKDSDDKLTGGSGDRFAQLYGDQHVFQEYTYKKITPCDVCREILRGHARQGLKCKMCKINVHYGECQERAPKCQPKPRLLRRQKSASELESRFGLPECEDDRNEQSSTTIDPVYELLRKAGDVGRRPGGLSSTHSIADRNWTQVMGQMGILPPHHSSAYHRARSSASSSGSSASSHFGQSHLSVASNPLHASSSAPHSPQRKKLTLRMKSFSLDESTQQVFVGRKGPGPVPTGQPQPSGSALALAAATMAGCSVAAAGGSTIHPGHSSASTSLSHNYASHVNPSMPSTCQEMRRGVPIKSAIRMSSVEIPDTNEKSSASPSPCPSPKPQRLLPTNIYVVLYEFRARHEDELDLKPGATVTVTDTSDLDWWQGKCYGNSGYFPSKYVAKLHPGERPLIMMATIQVSDGETGMIKLLRDQIVIQVGDEVDGTIRVRTGASDKTAPVPVKYVQEI